MEIDEALVAHLTSDGAISALVGSKVRPLRADPDDTAPYIVYQRIVTTEEHSHSGPTGVQLPHSHSGPTGVQLPRFQFSCVGTSYDQARDLAIAVRASLNGFSGEMGGGGGVQVARIKVDNEVEDYEFDTNLERVLLDATISHY
jgi:hypothetical protein